MKKLVCLVLALSMMICLAACGGKPAANSEAPTQESNTPTSTNPGVSSNDDTTYELRMAMTSTSMTFASDIADLISDSTNGRVTVSIVDSQSLGGATDCLDMVREGTLDLLMLPAAQTAGEFPVSDIVQVPFFVPDAECGQQVMYALYEAGYLTEYDDGTVPLFFATTDSQMLGFKENVVVNSISDFSGMKIRAVSGITTNLVEDIMHASVVTMGMNDVYLSLSTNVIDAAFSSPVQMVSYSFADVMGSMMNYPCYVGVLYCVANEDFWNSLPADIQEEIRSACETKRNQIREYYSAEESRCIEALANSGVNVYEPNEALRNEMVTNGQALQSIFEEKLNSLGHDGAAIMKTANDVIAAYN